MYSLQLCSTAFAGDCSGQRQQKCVIKLDGGSQLNFVARAQKISNSRNEGGGSGGGHRRPWRRRKLTKKDEIMDYKMQRVPFLEEKVRKIRQGGQLLSMDIEKLLLSEDNRFDFVNDVAAEAKRYVENDRDEYGAKKAILHVISNRMNDAGFYRPEAYIEPDPFKPGPGYLKDELQANTGNT